MGGGRIKSESLVDIRKFCPGIKVRLDANRLKYEKTAYVRLSVAKKLRRAQKLLPKGWNFVIRDAWRPAYVQAAIYFNFLRKGKQRFPGLSDKEIKNRVDKFVAPWKGVGASGHMTGGAIDVRLIDKSGRRLPMVSHKLSYQENALPQSKNLPMSLMKNRQIMADALRQAGFSNNIREYWHWSYGDYYWAKRTKNKVIYGVAVDNKIYYNRDCPCGSEKKFIKCHGK